MEDDDEEVDQTLFDSVILQVFEEQEDRSGSLTYPLSTQRDALDFVKLINRKGFPYVLMCQAIDEKQEKFRSWRLGNGNPHIGLVMMKRINKTVQEAMMLPDADVDVDIDDLTDEEEEDEEVQISDDDDFLTTDDDERHLATSPTSATAEDAERSSDATDTEPSAAETTSPVTASSNDDDISKTKNDLTESPAIEEQQQQPINSDDVIDDTGDLPGPSQSTTEPQVEDVFTSCQEELIKDHSECPRDEDRTNNLAENQRELCNDDGGNVQSCSSDTVDTSSEVCQSAAAEAATSDINIPSTSSPPESPAVEPTNLLSASPEHSEEQNKAANATVEPPQASEERDKDGENDMKCVSETADQTEIEQPELEVTVQNDPQICGELLESQVESILDSTDGPATQTVGDQSASVEEKQEEIANDVETSEQQRSSSTAGDEPTSQLDDEVGHDEVKVTEEPPKVTEEVKVVYEASAKQLDLLSRLAMLREKAAQRKAQQGSDTDESTQEGGVDTAGSVDTASSRHTEDSTRPQDRSDSPLEQNKDVFRRISIEKRRRTDSNENKETETDKQTDITRTDGDTEQDRQGTLLSPNVVTENNSQLVSGTTNDNTESVTTQDDVKSEVQKTETSTAENVHLSVTEDSTTPTHSDTHDTENSQVSEATTPANVSLQSASVLDLGSSSAKDQTNTKTLGPAENELGSGTAMAAVVQTSVDSISMQGDRNSRESASAAISGAVSQQSPITETEYPENGQNDTKCVSETVDQRSPTSHPRCAVLPPEISNQGGTGHSGTVDEQVDQLDNIRDDAINYDSDLDPDFADSDARQLISDIQTLKSSKADGQGYLYVLADRSRQRFTVGASRSPAKRLRQAAAFNPDLTLLTSAPVPRRLAALGELRRRLARNSDVTCLPKSRDWFAGSDDVVKELVRQVVNCQK